jgi:hypothetical protein
MRDRQNMRQLDILARFRYRDASNPRDKVIGLLGLFEDSEAEVPSDFADYTISPTELFSKVALGLIRQMQSLAPLIGFRNEPRQTPGLPSWICDWVQPSDETYMCSRYWDHIFRYQWFKADDDQPLIHDSDDPITTLTLQGYLIDTVAKTGEVVMRGPRDGGGGRLYPPTVIRLLQQWRHVAETLSQDDRERPYICGGSREDAFWRTLIGNIITVDNAPVRAAIPDDHQKFLDYCDKRHEHDCKCEIFDTIRCTAPRQKSPLRNRFYDDFRLFRDPLAL